MQKRKSSRRRLVIAAAAASASSVLFVDSRSAHAATYVWNTTSSGSWINNAAWTPSTGFPNAPGDVADLSTKDISGTLTVSLNAPIAVGGIKIGDTNNSNP